MEPTVLLAAGVLEGAQTAPGTGPIGLAWLIPVVPAVSALLLLLVGKRLGALGAWVAIAAAGYTAVASTLVFTFLQAQPEGSRTFVREVATWIAVGDLEVGWALLVDPLASVMLLLVTWVGLLIHIYSLGYMHGDAHYTRFFAYLNLFLASMLVLVLGESLLTMFVGWELVGLCSYLLIGFWFHEPANASAAKKAFVVNRVGDVGFMIAMFVTFQAVGSLSLVTVLPAGAALATGTAVAIGLLLFLAATGKSAQIPLFVWLPDAMAGPTPVSALIHAATMVTAGVYLVARMSPLYAAVPSIGLLIAWVGIATALLAALVACVQRDLKRILAYSTVSQLGFMFVGVGLGDQVAGVFHLLTHGFFKALLFLAAGSVMHALANQTDVWRMGGLWRVMPVTAVTAGIGTLAIAGIPPLSGFFSKEAVLVAALDTPGAQGIWVVGAAVAGLTAFYMARWFFLIFLGRPRWQDGEVEVHPHESPPAMTVPLVLLAVGAAAGGLLDIPTGDGFLSDWLAPSIVPFAGDQPLLGHTLAEVLVVAVAVIGIAWAYTLYVRRPLDVDAVAARTGGAYALALHGFYVDELYEATLAHPGHLLARGLTAFDQRGIDGLVNGTAALTVGLAQATRRLQTGFVRSYALAVLAGTVLITVLLLAGLYLGGVR